MVGEINPDSSLANWLTASRNICWVSSSEAIPLPPLLAALAALPTADAALSPVPTVAPKKGPTTGAA